jgi:hypothetical protein
MPRNFNVWPPNNPRAVMRLVLAVLLFANLVAFYFVIRPIGGSPQDLRQQVATLRTQIRQQQSVLDRTRLLAGKIEIGRGEGDSFMGRYFLPRRAAYSAIVGELNNLAGQSKIVSKETSFGIEQVDGSDTLEMLQISANYDATYQDLIHFVNLLDKSDRLLIIESLAATPQQGGNRLNVLFKLDTFVREDASTQ